MVSRFRFCSTYFFRRYKWGLVMLPSSSNELGRHKRHRHKLLPFLPCHFQKRKMATKQVQVGLDVITHSAAIGEMSGVGYKAVSSVVARLARRTE